MVKWLLDATESSRQLQRSEDRLDEFFEPFSDTATWQPSQLHVIAMNTGTVVRFDHRPVVAPGEFDPRDNRALARLS